MKMDPRGSEVARVNFGNPKISVENDDHLEF